MANLLLVATDRLSAFDVILPTPIPDKGKVLTQLSRFWFETLQDVVPNHVITTTDFPPQLDAVSAIRWPAAPCCAARPSPSWWSAWCAAIFPAPAGRTIAPRAPSAAFPCLPGSVNRPACRSQSSRRPPRPLPDTTKISRSIRWSHPSAARWPSSFARISMDLYRRAVDFAEPRGIILADTKFEFGLIGDQIIWIDEALTPDSSRFWPAQGYAPGRPQPSFDKQYVRDYLEQIGWNKQPPAPELPAEIVAATRAKYREAYRLLTGRELS